jgi:alginate O-acetyltransferase complex protein AlgI
MIFNQFEFLLLFLPVVLCLFGISKLRAFRSYLLIAGSLIFYGLSGWEHSAVLVIDIVWVWWIIRTPAIVGNRLRLTLAVLPPFLALIYYKYLGFVLDQFMGSSKQETSGFDLFDQIILPAGISFFTFQIAAYAIDRYRGDIPDPPPISHLALYISFFPQLVAGPILRYHDVAKALKGLGSFSLHADAAARGLGYIVVGLGVKVLIADTLGGYISQIIMDLSTIGKLGGIFIIGAYSFQLYFDFYGYSMIAIGLGALFGFSFPDNFKRPYESLNIGEFWRRWHVTLSYWIRDYLYLPLGGNTAYKRNIFIVFAICGLWHGAGWNFVVWGLAHGLLVALHHRFQKPWAALPKLAQQTTTFLLVAVLWLLFLFDFGELMQFAAAVWYNPWQSSQVTWEMWVTLAMALVVCFGPSLEQIAENRLGSPAVTTLRNVGFAGVLTMVLIFLDRSQTFIYFRF